MAETPYSKQTWRDMGVTDLVGHAHDTVKLAVQHFNDGKPDELVATLDVLRDQVDVLHDRRDELAGAIAERTASLQEEAAQEEGSPALQE